MNSEKATHNHTEDQATRSFESIQVADNNPVYTESSVDAEKFSQDEAVIGVLDPEMEKKICRKLDIRILPFICVLYLFNALDKGNISNAKTDGFDVDLGIHGNKWNILLCIFYIPFVLCAFPISLIIKRYNAANVIPILVFTFGSITLLSVTVFNFGSIVAVRWFLGMCESAFFPGIIYYLSTMYRRTEFAKRLALFYSFANVANAVSGLLAYGAFQINDGRLKGWQYLFIIDGSCTVVLAVISFFYLPRTIDEAKFFTQEEKDVANYRIATDSSSEATLKENFKMKDAFDLLKHPVSILWLVIEICVGVPINCINNWFPQIIQSMGKDKLQTNLFTVAPNMSGAIFCIVICTLSDVTKVRSYYIIFSFLITLIGFVLFGCIDVHKQSAVAYFSTFLMTAGGSSSSVLLSSWYTNNTPNANRRVVISSIGIPLTNVAGFIAIFIFRPQDQPKYIPALGTTAGFGGLGAILTGLTLLYMVKDNWSRNRKQGFSTTYKDVSTNDLSDGPSNPNFRWMY